MGSSHSKSPKKTSKSGTKSTGRRWSIQKGGLHRSKKSKRVVSHEKEDSDRSSSSFPSSTSSEDYEVECVVEFVPQSGYDASSASSPSLSSSFSSLSDHEARDIDPIVVAQKSHSSSSTSSSSSDRVKDVAVVAVQKNHSSSSSSSSSNSSSKRDPHVLAAADEYERSSSIFTSTTSSRSSSIVERYVSTFDTFDPSKTTSSPSPSSSSSGLVDQSSCHAFRPAAAVMQSARGFSKGTITALATTAYGSPRVSVTQTQSGALYNVPPSVNRPGARSLISAFTEAYCEKPDLSLTDLVLATSNKMREGGNVLRPELSGLTGDDLRHYRANFLSVQPNTGNKAVLIGIGSYGEAGGGHPTAITDLRELRAMLAELGWSTGTDSMRVMTDDRKFSNCCPTSRNILKHLRWLVKDAVSGSTRLFVFAGARSTARTDAKTTFGGVTITSPFHRNEPALLPKGFAPGHLVLESQIYAALANLPEGVNFTFIGDCSNGGTALHLPLAMALTHDVESYVHAATRHKKMEVYFAKNPSYHHKHHLRED